MCWGDGCRSEKFGFGHDDFEVRFRHPRSDAEQVSGYRSWGFRERAELDLQTGCHWQIGGVSKLEIVCGHLGNEYRQKRGVTQGQSPGHSKICREMRWKQQSRLKEL